MFQSPAVLLDPPVQPGHEVGQQKAADAADRRQHNLPRAHITGGDDNQCGGQHDAEDPVESDWSSASGRTSSPALPAAGLSAPSPAGRRRAPGSPAGPAPPAWAGTAPGPSLPRRRSCPGITRLMPHRAPQKLYHQKLGSTVSADHFSYVKQAEEDGTGAHRHD